jgi:hypothetical protein
MPEYRYLCPRCGKAFEEGTAATVCPDCQVLLRSTGGIGGGMPSPPVPLPAHLDMAELIQAALAEEPDEQELDEALRRVLHREHPESEEALFRAIDEVLNTQRRVWGFSRLEAARRMAEGHTEMNLSPEGKPQITSFYFQGAGLEQLTAEMREQVLHYVEEAARTGQPLCKKLVLKPPARPVSRQAPLVLAVVTALAVAAFYCLGRLLGGK